MLHESAIDVIMNRPGEAEDGYVIQAMLRVARIAYPGEALPSGQIVGPQSDAVIIWTCAHFDVETRNCGIYEKRPRMCREYPYGRPCELPGCTLEPRHGRLPILSTAQDKQCPGQASNPCENAQPMSSVVSVTEERC
ncbi:MAG: YkgJ family cysteine cluster protein [Polyangiaceae bacterium]|nr:YkgJ family cysteine cluster protein [Polyangiaceae bacterium]